jgi:hypothetical protein
MKTLTFFTILAFLTTQFIAFSQVTFEASVVSSDGYNVDIEVQLLNIVAPQSCPNGYNYNIELGYDVAFNGSNIPANLWTLQGSILNCGNAPSIFFGLPNQGGGGTLTTTSNPWRSQADCATASLASFGCENLEITISGPGIPQQTIPLQGTASNNGNNNNTSGCAQGDLCDTTKFLGTINNNPLIFQTNNTERLNILPSGNIGIGFLNFSNSSYLLDVNGNARFSGNSQMENLNVSASGTFGSLAVNGNTVINGNLSVDSLSILQNTSFYNLHVENQLRVGNSIYLNDQGTYDEITASTNKLTIAAADNNGIGNYNDEIFVGIGTNDPQKEFHLKGRTCVDCPIIGNPGGVASTVYMRLEDEVYNQGNPNSSLYSRYWDIGVSGVGGNLFLTTEQLGNNIFNISNQGKITAYDFRYRDNNGNGEEFFSSAHFGNLSYLQLKKDWTFLSFSDSDPDELHPNGVWAIEYEPNAEGLNFWKPWPNETGTGNYFLFLANDGNIGMGTNCTPYKLNVDGVIGAREVIVELEDWCDYVFEKDYKLMPLSEVKEFIIKNGHLPKIAPAIEIETEGLNLGEIQKIQMEKIEELTLYTIAQQEQLEEHKMLIEKQSLLIEQQQKLMEEQRKAFEELKNNQSK